jgi:hypothetical protein
MPAVVTPAMHNRTLPRAAPEDVQKVVDLWKAKHGIVKGSEETRGRFRAWAYHLRQHFFAPLDVFDPRSWSVEDVAVCLEELQKC